VPIKFNKIASIYNDVTRLLSKNSPYLNEMYIFDYLCLKNDCNW